MSKVRELPFDGKHSVNDALPEPNVQLYITVDENKDRVGGGAAAFGNDGKWYWTFNGEMTDECKYRVSQWCYL